MRGPPAVAQALGVVALRAFCADRLAAYKIPRDSSCYLNATRQRGS